MSTFQGKLAEEEFKDCSIDSFEKHNYEAKAFFLSHYHSDHMRGLSDTRFHMLFQSDGGVMFYCSKITKKLILKNRKIDIPASRIVELESRSLFICPNDICIKITPLRAGHCPGSIMFLLQAIDTTVLYTGDFRLSLSDLKKCKPLHTDDGKPIKLDNLYLDTTFATPEYSIFPTREQSLDCILQLIKKSIDSYDYIVVKQPAFIGQEFLMVGIYKELKMQIYICDEICFYFCSCIEQLRNVITTTIDHTKIHFCPPRSGTFKCSPCPILEKRFEKILTVRPTAMIFDQEKIEQGGVIQNDSTVRIAYSSHSSLEELSEFATHLEPDKITPLVESKNLTNNELVDNILCYTKPYNVMDVQPVATEEKSCHFSLTLTPVEQVDYLELGLESP